MKKTKDFQQLLDEDFILAPIIKLALPLTLTSFIQTFYNLVDTYWLGRLGTSELAAINLVTPIQHTIVAFGSGITVAGAILLSQNIGAKKNKEANKIAGQIFIFALIFSLLSCLIILTFSSTILNWMGCGSDIFAYSQTYLSLVLLGIPFLYTINIYTSINQSQGESVHPMLLNLIGTVLNIFLDPLLIMVLHLGVFGAGLATLFSKGVIALIALFLMLRSKKPVKLQVKYFRLEKETIKKILHLGLPLSFGNATMQFGFMLLSKSVLSYGSVAMAAYGIGNKVNGLITLPVQGISSALSTIVGLYVGKNNEEKIRKAYVVSQRICLAFLLVGGIILSRPVISRAIVSIFTQDPRVIDMGSKLFSIMSLYSFTNAIHNTTKAVFNGEGKTTLSVVTDLLRIWIFRFSFIYVLSTFFAMGINSIWYAIVISNGLAAFVSLVIYLLKFKNKPLKIHI